MKITDKIISIPPFISTSWDKVSSLHVQDEILIITLKDSTRVSVPNLSEPTVHDIFNAHAHFMEQQNVRPLTPVSEQPFVAPFRMLFGTLESLTQALQHNPAYSNLAPLPQEIVGKLEMLAKTLPPEELSNYLHPVDGCNCMYCQISRILKGQSQAPGVEEKPLITESDEVKDEDLRFEQWIVEQTGDKVYQVTNKLDPQEHYSVYLGDPIGCTCGKQNCEHIVAVLRH